MSRSFDDFSSTLRWGNFISILFVTLKPLNSVSGFSYPQFYILQNFTKVYNKNMNKLGKDIVTKQITKKVLELSKNGFSTREISKILFYKYKINRSHSWVAYTIKKLSEKK